MTNLRRRIKVKKVQKKKVESSLKLLPNNKNDDKRPLVVCQVRKGQDKLMGPICCTQNPFILTMINQSHCLPLSGPYSADPQVDPETHTSTSTVVLFLCHDSHKPPMFINPCSMFRFLLCHDHILLHLPFVIMTILLTVSPTLVLLLTYSLLLFIFSYWSMC